LLQALKTPLIGQRHSFYFTRNFSFFSKKNLKFKFLFFGWDSSKTIQKAVLSVFALNGVLFLGGQLLLEALHPRTLFGCSFLVIKTQTRKVDLIMHKYSTF
jgi:hypothetical protein